MSKISISQQKTIMIFNSAFNLKNKAVIERHIHNEQNRNIKTTSEVLVVLEGELRVEIFDYELDLVETVNVFQHDTIALFGGGHGIEVKQDTKFIEVKQGPYDPETDKKDFKMIKVFEPKLSFF